MQFKYGEDGIDPAHSVRGKAIDVNDLLVEVLGDDAKVLIEAEDNDGESYGSREKDEENIDDYERDSDGDEDASDYDDVDYEGGE